LHLGDRLITPDGEHPITKPFRSRHIYQRLKRLEGPCRVEPLTVQEAAVIVGIANRFRWEVPASGTLLLGWAVLAPICGALRWRPHLWLTAGAGSGKSQILDRFVAPLLGDLSLVVVGATTEAGLRQTICCDAVPVVFDEAESNEKGDQQRMQAILSLARVASSESIRSRPSGARLTSASRCSSSGAVAWAVSWWQAWTLPTQPGGRPAPRSTRRRGSSACRRASTSEVPSVDPSS
jgi:putative DNA primase/helicase